MLDPENKVVYVNDWLLHNTIRADRKTNSVYKDLLLKILPDVKMVEKKPRTDRIPKLEQHNVDSPELENEIIIKNQEENILNKILNLFKKYSIDENTLRIFQKKFDDDLIFKQLQNLEIEIKRGIKIENISAWLFVACDRNYPLKTQEYKNLSNKKREENTNKSQKQLEKQLKLLENEAD